MVALEDWWSPVPLFILFRESIEASIIVSVLLQFLNRAGPWLKRQVWYGVLMGVCVSIVIGIIFIVIYYQAKDNLFQGRNQFIFKGATAWLASFLITILAFAMLRFMGWEEKWKRRLGEAAKKVQEEEATTLANIAAAALENGGDGPATPPPPPPPTGFMAKFTAKFTGIFKRKQQPKLPKPQLPAPDTAASPATSQPGCLNKLLRRPVNAAADSPPLDEDAEAKKLEEIKMKALHDMLPPKQRYSLFLLAFITVVREGLETVVFLAGVGNAKASAIPVAGLLGILCGVAVGVFLYYSGRQIQDIKWLMFIMSTVIFFIGAGQAEMGANSLMLGGAFGTYVPPSGLAVPTAEYHSLGLLPANGAAIAASGGAAAAFNDGDDFIDYTSQFVGEDGYTNPARTPQPWYFVYLWDINGCCSDKDEANRFLSLMKQIFGYNSNPCFIDVVSYCGYWVLVLSALLWKLHRGTLLDADYKHTREMKAKAKQAERDALEAKGIYVPPEPVSIFERAGIWTRATLERLKCWGPKADSAEVGIITASGGGKKVSEDSNFSVAGGKKVSEDSADTAPYGKKVSQESDATASGGKNASAELNSSTGSEDVVSPTQPHEPK